MRQLRPAEADARLREHPAPVLLDVREPWEVAVCYIEGSLHVPMARVPAALRGLDPAQEIIVLCHHGMRSQQVALYLLRAGFDKVSNLAGGIDAWAREVDGSLGTY